MAVKILFVCHGNICRSPVAEFVFRNIAKKAGQEADFLIASAATTTDEIVGGVGILSIRRLGRHSCVMALTL